MVELMLDGQRVVSLVFAIAITVALLCTTIYAITGYYGRRDSFRIINVSVAFFVFLIAVFAILMIVVLAIRLFMMGILGV